MSTAARLPQVSPTIDPLLEADRWGKFGEWVRKHDESWLFVAIYLGLAVGLSVFVSLFWLVAVGVFHLVLELLRQAYYRDTWPSVVVHALWEIKMDVGLILLALTLVLYLEVVLGLLGLQSAARAAAATRIAHAGARSGTRVAQGSTRAAQAAARAGTRAGATGTLIEQWVRGVLLAIDEMARVAYATLVVRKKNDDPSRKKGAESAGPEEDADRPEEPAPDPVPAFAHPAWSGPWGIADHLGLLMVGVGILLIILAPHLTAHEWDTAIATLIDELRPLGPRMGE